MSHTLHNSESTKTYQKHIFHLITFKIWALLSCSIYTLCWPGEQGVNAETTSQHWLASSQQPEEKKKLKSRGQGGLLKEQAGWRMKVLPASCPETKLQRRKTGHTGCRSLQKQEKELRAQQKEQLRPDLACLVWGPWAGTQWRSGSRFPYQSHNRDLRLEGFPDHQRIWIS